MTPDLGKLTSYVDKRIEQLDKEREAMYERLPLQTPLEVLVNRVNEQDELIHKLMHRIVALEEMMTKPDVEVTE